MHPYKSHVKGGQRIAKMRYGAGGAIDEDIDVRSEEEKPTSVGPYGLGGTMQYEQSVKDRKEVDAGKRFYDTGTRVPGRQKAANDRYMDRLKGR